MGVASTKRNARARRPTPRTAGGNSSWFNVVARILAWYTLYTVLFRCPTVPPNDSPTICHTSHAISNALRPHLDPYYDTYVSPYITQYGPGVKHANDHYIIPLHKSVSSSYEKFAAPRVARGREYASKEYNRSVKPRVDEVYKKARVFYDGHLSPHVATANEFYATAQPYLAKAGETAELFYNDFLVPVSKQSLPYVLAAYERLRHFTVTIIAPLVKANGEKAARWCIGVWSEVVRPQVGRIGKRLGGTGSGVPAASISTSIFSSFSSADAAKATASAASLSSIISHVSAEAASAKASASSQAAEANQGEASGNEAEKPTKEEIREIVKADLVSSKVKFGVATEKATRDLNSQIDEISIGARNKQEIHVQKEIEALEELIEREFSILKKAARELAKPVDPEKENEHRQKSEETFAARSRESGIKIRDKAQSIRIESQQFLSNVYAEVVEAADSHLEVLDSVLDLAMQELGMKWAWMDYVTYKDWQKYHELKKDFDNLRRNVVVAAQKNQKLTDITRWTEGDWEGKATEIAKEAADELKRLKAVSKRKIQLSDPSDDFSESIVPVAAHRAAQVIMKEAEGALSAAEKLVGEASEEAIGTEQPTARSVASVASEKAKSATSVASEKAYGTEPNAGEKAAPEAVLGKEEPTPVTASISSVASEIKESMKPKIWGGVDAGFVAGSRVEYDVDDDEESIGEKAQSAADAASSKFTDASRAVSEAIAGATTARLPGEKHASIASEKYEATTSAASSALYGTPQRNGESLVSIATDKYSAAVAAASSAISKLAENAASAASEKIYGTPQPFTESAASVAGEYIATATTKAEQEYESMKALISELVCGKEPTYTESVMSRFSSLWHATPTPSLSHTTHPGEPHGPTTTTMTPPPSLESIISHANAQVQSAISAASDQVYGPTSTHGSVESITSVVGEGYSSAHSRVSSAIYGREPTAAFESASARINAAVESAKSAISEAVYGTEKGTAEQATSAITQAASTVTEAVAAAVSDARARASEAVCGPEKGFVESAQRRVEIAVESGRRRLREVLSGYVERASKAAPSVIVPPEPQAHEKVASSVSSATRKAKEAYERAREEL